MKRMQIPIGTTYRGMISIPDFAVEKFIEENTTVFGFHKGETMTLTPENLINDVAKKGAVRTSLVTHEYFRYSLYYYKWKPDGEASRS